MDEVEKQRQFYASMAQCYDAMCAHDCYDEHFVASAVLCGLIDLYGVRTLLDVGCGTGRSLAYLKQHKPELALSGIEPVEALRKECYAKGFSEVDVRDGDACRLHLPDASVDCVSMFGVLHHIPTPALAIQEALRVASKMVIISDHNIYGMGSYITRLFKQTFRQLGLRKTLGWLMTKGKGFHDTDWDGVFYPFSLVDHFPQIQTRSVQTFAFSTKTPAINLFRDASHLAIVAVKQLPVDPRELSQKVAE